MGWKERPAVCPDWSLGMYCTSIENQGPTVDGMVWHGQIIKSFSVARPQATATLFSEVFGKIRFMNYAGCKPGT